MNSSDTSIYPQDELPDELSDGLGVGFMFIDWIDGFPQEEQSIDFDFSEYCNSPNDPPCNSSNSPPFSSLNNPPFSSPNNPPFNSPNNPPFYSPNNPPYHSRDDSGGRVDPIFYDLSNLVDENPTVAFCHGKARGYECSNSSIDSKLNDAMLCNGKKLSMKQKIAIFNFALEKLNAKGSGSTINRLNRDDTRRQVRLNNRLKEILPYLENLKEKGPLSDFKELLRIVHPMSNL